MVQPASSGKSKTWVWIVLVVFAWLAWSMYQQSREADQPTSFQPYVGVNQPISDDPGSFLDPAEPPGGTYYENPAPGDDGSYDCPPGGGPVYVGSNDPAGLDGDGDGWGCE